MNASVVSEAGSKPRVSGDREAEILEGVLDLLTEVGYDKLTFDAVAGRVRASKATLYRKWPSKAELVVSAVEQLKSTAQPAMGELPDTGSLEGDLTSQFCSDPDYSEKITQVMNAVTSAIHRDPELTTVLSDRFITPQTERLLEVMRRAQQRGEVGPDADLDLLVSMVPAAITYRVMAQGCMPDPAYIAKVIEDVLLPACRASVKGSGTKRS
ncbi:TetR/AcrR family transcriptional regulator [Flexivirga caeni]|uniref:TetR/AcrR family transcriptional regulator n=1 Tax=Flexivirga caeni TaxID=2294115 RepID=A0A3M9MDJ3_9MICO|nr:TetR/AcrR family transcriptional regulator [Flexivirga caeni]RNI23217.1 TetR/AcrR family transcriptional regulator [Flexivirga caeni]